jgi:hypothetical protein
MGTSPETPRRSAHDPSAPQKAEHGTTIVLMSSDDNSEDPLNRAGNPDTEHGKDSDTVEEQRPPLPPRPSLLQTGNGPSAPQSPSRPSLQAKATTAVSSLDIQTLSFPDGSRGTFSTPAGGTVSEEQGTPSRKVSRNGSDLDDDASLLSFAPTSRGNGDLASLLDDELNTQSPAWRMLNSQSEAPNLFETVEYEDTSLANFEHEFDEIEAVNSKEGNEGNPKPLAAISSLIGVCRGDSATVEVETQALPHIIICRQAYLQPAR